MRAMPLVFYKNPEEACDYLRELRKKMDSAANNARVLERQHKALRIQALVRNVMNGGDKDAKR